MIADLACERRCTEAQLDEGPWAEWRSLAQARDGYRVLRGAALQEQRALLELTWPSLLAQIPKLPGTHLQATLRLGLSPEAIGALPLGHCTERLRREHPQRLLRWMAQRLWQAAQPSQPDDHSPAATLRLQLAAQRTSSSWMMLRLAVGRITQA